MLDGRSSVGNIAVLDIGTFRAYRDKSIEATWRSGDAADCKSAYPGSIPGVASKHFPTICQRIRALTELAQAGVRDTFRERNERCERPLVPIVVPAM